MQSGLFYSQRQKVNEKVDNYAQDFSRLDQKIYSQANQGSQDTEAMGKTIIYELLVKSSGRK